MVRCSRDRTPSWPGRRSRSGSPPSQTALAQRKPREWADALAARDGLLRTPAGRGERGRVQGTGLPEAIEAERVRMHASGRMNARAGYLKQR